MFILRNDSQDINRGEFYKDSNGNVYVMTSKGLVNLQNLTNPTFTNPTITNGTVDTATITNLKPANGIGTAANVIEATEYGDYHRHITVLEIDTPPEKAVAGAALTHGFKMYTFPEGGIYVDKVRFEIDLILDSESAIVDLGLGTAQGSGASASLSSTEEDIVAGYSPGSWSDGVLTANNFKASAGNILDGSTTAKDLYLNFGATWSQTGSVFITGKIVVFWEYLGDYGDDK